MTPKFHERVHALSKQPSNFTIRQLIEMINSFLGTHLTNFYAIPLQNINSLAQEARSIIESINENIDNYASDPDSNSIKVDLNALKSSFDTIIKLQREDIDKHVDTIKNIETTISNDFEKLKNKEKTSRIQSEDLKDNSKDKDDDTDEDRDIVKPTKRKSHTDTIVNLAIAICLIIVSYFIGQHSITSEWKDEWIKKKIQQVLLDSIENENSELNRKIEEIIDKRLNEFKEAIIKYIDNRMYGYRILIDTQPANCTIRILRIKEKYKPQMRLKPSSYQIVVSKKGYKTKKSWIEVNENSLKKDIAVFTITLDKIK